MYKVLIAEDEYRQRVGLKSLLNRLRPGYEIFEAEDGSEALEILKKQYVDIIITDIRMSTDGLYMMQKIREIGIDPKIIVVSGYAIFEYAQKAVGFGAFDYLLKPVTEQKLNAVFEKVEKTIAEERNTVYEKEVIKERLSRTLPVYSKSLLNDWVLGRLDISRLEDIASIFNKECRGMAIICRINPTAGLTQSIEYISSIKDITEKALKQFPCLISFEFGNKGDTLVFIISAAGASTESIAKDLLKSAADRIQSSCGVTVTFAIGEVCHNILKDIAKSFEQALRAMLYSFYPSAGPVLYLPDIPCRHECCIPAGDEELADAIIQQNRVKSLEALDNIFEQLLYGGYPEPQQAIQVLTYIVLNAVKPLKTFIDKDAFTNITNNISKSLLSCCNFNEARETIINIILPTIDKLEKLKNNKSQNTINKCLKYLEENFDKEISLESVAEAFYFNPSYFSSLFKSCTGVTFTQYLHKLRVLKAEQLLRNTNKKVYEIAKMSGYSSVKYFNSVFRKEYGATPEEYRHALAGK